MALILLLFVIAGVVQADVEFAKSAFVRSHSVLPFHPQDLSPAFLTGDEPPFTLEVSIPTAVKRGSVVDVDGQVFLADSNIDSDVAVTLRGLPHGVSLKSSAGNQLNFRKPKANVVPFKFQLDVGSAAIVGANNFWIDINNSSYPAGFAVDSEVVSLHIFAFNDFHGRIINSGSGATRTGAVALGMKLAELKEEYPNSVILAAGDSIGGTIFESSASNDVPTMHIVQELGVQAAVVGNHEFDRGFDFLIDSMPILGDQLGGNVFRVGAADTEPVFPSYKILEQGGLKVGVIGVVTEAVPTLVVSTATQGLEFRPALPVATRVANELKNEHQCDVVICLFHQGGSANSLDGELERNTEFSNFLKGIADDSHIDIVMTGHTHRLYAWDQSGRPIVQAGSYASHITHFQVDVTQADRRIIGAIAGQNIAAQSPVYWNATTNSWRNGEDTVPEEEIPQSVRNIRDIVVGAIASSDVVGSRVVGRIAEAFPGTRGVESPLGLLIADAMLHEVQALAGHEDAVIAIMNDGGVRADLPFQNGGVVTVREIVTVQPFANSLFVASMNGATLLAILEQQWQETRTFVHLVAGMTYAYDNRRLAKVILERVFVQGEPLVLDKIYKVVTNSFLAGGGDGFSAFLAADLVDTGLIDTDVLINYVSRLSEETGALVPTRFERIFNVEDDLRDSVDLTLTGTIGSKGEMELAFSASSLVDVAGPLRFVFSSSSGELVHTVTGLTAGNSLEHSFNATQELWMFSEVFDRNPIPGGVRATVQFETTCVGGGDSDGAIQQLPAASFLAGLIALLLAM